MNFSHNSLSYFGVYEECKSKINLESIDLSSAGDIMSSLLSSESIFNCVQSKNVYLRNNKIKNLQEILDHIPHKQLRTLDLRYNIISDISVRATYLKI